MEVQAVLAGGKAHRSRNRHHVRAPDGASNCQEFGDRLTLRVFECSRVTALALSPLDSLSRPASSAMDASSSVAFIFVSAPSTSFSRVRETSQWHSEAWCAA